MRRKRISIDALKTIPILDVADALQIPLRPTGSGLWNVKDPDDAQGFTSLCITERKNRWKRWSGKERGGVSGGSTIDLVMHWRECEFQEAIEWLTSTFPHAR